MKRVTTLLVLVGAALLFVQDDIFARGGGAEVVAVAAAAGGGGGGGGGAMSAAAGRSPSMGGGGGARPAARPAGGAARPVRARLAHDRDRDRAPVVATGAGRRWARTTGTGCGQARRKHCRGRPALCRPIEQLPGHAAGFDRRCRCRRRCPAGRRRRRSRFPARRWRGRSRHSFRPDPALVGRAWDDRASVAGRRRWSGRRRWTGRHRWTGRRRWTGHRYTWSWPTRRRDPSGRRAGPESVRTIVPAASRTGKSCRATASSGATRSAIRSPRTTRVSTSGATIPAGRRGASHAPYRWATWAALGGWIGYGAGEPTTYAYGENVYYEGDQVYYGDQAGRDGRPICRAGRRDRRQRTADETREQRVAAVGRFRPHAGRSGHRRGADPLLATRH